MKARRITAAVAAVTLASAGAVHLADTWHHRPLVAVPSDQDEDGTITVFGVAGPDLDEKALREAKTLEDFKNVRGLRFETGDPTPSPWRR